MGGKAERLAYAKRLTAWCAEWRPTNVIGSWIKNESRSTDRNSQKACLYLKSILLYFQSADIAVIMCPRL